MQEYHEYDTREKACIEEVMVYLDALRESGITNMFGAAPYIVEEFGVDKRMARKLLAHWMRTFEKGKE